MAVYLSDSEIPSLKTAAAIDSDKWQVSDLRQLIARTENYQSIEMQGG